ncbi:DUF5074 domain-containing protein [Alistipes onderdonkii]|uniref:DUF5074 domain-containing protein n=1 Tax=Alistipes onderdonkii TaxID=328813 RepID=UPI0018AAB7F9|nr:DUF5074 domain-containing protein [Alistipes onderdonkii]
MKKLFTLLTVMLLGVSTWSCSYDDDDLWNEIGNIKTELARINKEVGTLQTLVDALNQQKTITSVEETATGYTITFNDGKTVEIKNGTNAPEVGIDLFEGVYYWTIGGKGNWLTDADGNKIPVAGKDGSKPQMAVDADGYWTVDGVRIKDAAGNDVKAAGSNGKDGDSFFESVTDGDDEVTFTLTDGTTIIIPKASAAGFAFVFPTQLPKGGTDVDNYYLFAFGEEKILAYTGDITTADLMSIPQGWAARIDPDKKTVTVTAPAFAGSYYTEGILSLVGIDGKGKTQLASARICAVDYSDPEGTFVLNEGNMSSDNGSVIYITANGRLINYAYWRMNGSELGNVGQDMFIADGKTYIISQNGGNDGILVEADARTLKRTGKFGKSDLPGLSMPSHVAVIGRMAYIRDNAGVYKLDLDTKALSFIEGSQGALKNRMAVVGNKVFVPAGKSILVLENGAVAETIAMDGTVTGVVKSDEAGYLWISCSASPAQIIKLAAGDYTQEKHTLTAGGVASGWGATPGITAKGDEIYFCNNSSTIYRHTFSSNTTETLGDVKSNIANWGMIYNMPAVHPVTGEYYYNTILGYGWSFLTNDISVYDLGSGTPKMVADYRNYTHFPAGIFFTAGF